MSSIDQITAGKLIKGNTPSVSITCAVASTDYAAAAFMPDSARYVIVSCAAAVVVSIGEATSATVGVGVTAGVATTFPVRLRQPGETDADRTLHAQSPTAGAVVRLTYMTDA